MSAAACHALLLSTFGFLGGALVCQIAGFLWLLLWFFMFFLVLVVVFGLHLRLRLHGSHRDGPLPDAPGFVLDCALHVLLNSVGFGQQSLQRVGLFGVDDIVVVAAVEFDQLREVFDQVEEETTAQVLYVVAHEVQAGQGVLVANTEQFCRLLQRIMAQTEFLQIREEFDAFKRGQSAMVEFQTPHGRQQRSQLPELHLLMRDREDPAFPVEVGRS